MPHIFISYAKKDTRPLAEALFKSLNAIPGLSAWMDQSLEADQSWAYQIQQEIDRADYVVVLLSPDVNRPVTPTQKRSFVLNEIDYAEQDNKPILPILVQQTKMPVQIAGIQYINLTATSNDPNPIVERVCQRYQIESPAQRQQREADERLRETAERAKQEEAQRRHQIADEERRQREAASRLQTLPANNVPPLPLEATALPTLSLHRPSIRLIAGGAFGIITIVLVAFLSQGGIRNIFIPIPPARALQLEPAAALERAVAYDYRTGNAAWTPISAEFEGITMMLVPPGCFMMGSEDGDEDEKPIHEQCFSQSFWIDQTEVTQVDFEQLGGVKNKPNAFDGDQRPVENITWFEASNFCAKRGTRLPTEREWEYAARGPDALIFPWGNSFDADNAVYAENTDETENVGSRSAGVSWVGTLDMGGNVWEWVSSIYGIDNLNFDFSEPGEKIYLYPYDAADGREQNSQDETHIRVNRGGSAILFAPSISASRRNIGPPNGRSPVGGVRCARDS